MKRILLALFMVFVLLLTGCSSNLKNSNDEMENNLTDNTHNQTDEEKYRISDTYYISGEILENDKCIINLLEKKYSNQYSIESDGIEFNITCNLLENNNEIEEYDVRINDKIIEFQNNVFDSSGEPFGYFYDLMWVIDLDESDQYKELVIERVYGLDSEFDIYRLTKNGLELVFNIGNSWNDLIKVEDRWVFTKYLYASGQYHITEGFYLYEDEEFKFIEKFATGEDITDQNGVFPDDFQKLEFYADGESVMLENEEGLIEGTFNFISYNKETKTYTIKLTKDGECYVYMSDLGYSTEVLPAGTILEDITLGLLW